MGNRGAEELLNICILFPFMPVCNSCSLYFFIFMRWGESCPLSCSNPSKTAPTWGGICDTCRKKEGERGERMKKKHGHLFYSSSDNALAAVLGKTTCLCPSSSLMPCADHSCQIYRGADLAGNPFPGLVHRTFVKVLVPAQHKRQQQGEKTGEGEGSELKRVQDPPPQVAPLPKDEHYPSGLPFELAYFEAPEKLNSGLQKQYFWDRGPRSIFGSPGYCYNWVQLRES